MSDIMSIQNAKDYIDKLANGINPVTNQEVSESDCVNNIKVSRCLFFISGLLRQMIDNSESEPDGTKRKKMPFSISAEQLKGFSISYEPLTLSEIARRINALVDSDSIKNLTYNTLASFLVDFGYLEKTTLQSGKTTKQPTSKGSALGIIQEERIGKDGRYLVNTYDSSAQKFILDSIPSIIEFLSKNQNSKTQR